jgi:hypothetical protein
MVYAGFGFPLSAYRDGQLVGHTGKSKVADLRRPPGFQEARYRQPKQGQAKGEAYCANARLPYQGQQKQYRSHCEVHRGWMQDSIYPAASTRALRTAHSYRM